MFLAVQGSPLTHLHSPGLQKPVDTMHLWKYKVISLNLADIMLLYLLLFSDIIYLLCANLLL